MQCIEQKLRMLITSVVAYCTLLTNTMVPGTPKLGSIWTLGHFIFLTPKRMQTCGNIMCFNHTSVCTELILAENVVPV